MSDSIDWARLPEYPVYNAAIMEPCPKIDSSVLGIVFGTVLTPDFAFEDTVRDEEKFTLKTFCSRYSGKDQNTIVCTSVDKEAFIRIMGECMRHQPNKLFPWQQPDFFNILDSSITTLCDTLNRSGIPDMFLHSGKQYVLSEGIGWIYKDDIPVGIFPGLVVSTRMDQKNGIVIEFMIPRIVYNYKAGNMSETTFTYMDEKSNISLSFSGKFIAPTQDGSEYKASVKRSSGDISISKISDGIYYMPNDSYTELMSKPLYLPMDNFGFRLDAVASNKQNINVTSVLPLQGTLSRITEVIG